MQATAEWLETDYYEVLGVAPDATKKDIKSAYRKLARTAHPDANPDDPSADQRFSDIGKAYEVLSDDERRAEYDDIRRRAAQGFRPGGDRFGNRYTSGGSVNFDDMRFDEPEFDISDLSDLFDMFGAHRRDTGHGPRTGFRSSNAGRDWPMRGADITARLELDFEEAVNGRTTTLELDGRSIKTRIPAGVSDGQTIRLAGKGSPGMNGGPDGDLLIEISVRKHPVFGRSGRDLTVTVPLSYPVAVLGGEMAVPTLDGGSVKVKIPAGTPVGKTFRISGRGVPGTPKPGDLLASVTIDVPTTVSDGDAELLRQLHV